MGNLNDTKLSGTGKNSHLEMPFVQTKAIHQEIGDIILHPEMVRRWNEVRKTFLTTQSPEIVQDFMSKLTAIPHTLPLKNKADILRNILNEYSPHTGNHVSRIEALIHDSAHFLPFESTKQLPLIMRVHDIGKIGIPESILEKPARLTPEEFELIKTHVSLGTKILHALGFNGDIIDPVKYHHIKQNRNAVGKLFFEGYDLDDFNRNENKELPFIAVFASFFDIYEAMTSQDRPYFRYGKPCAPVEALEIMKTKVFSDPVYKKNFKLFKNAIELGQIEKKISRSA